MSNSLTVTKKAVMVAGGGFIVSRELGVSYESIRRWQANDTFDPSLVQKLCQMTGGAFTPAQIRPDIFGGA